MRSWKGRREVPEDVRFLYTADIFLGNRECQKWTSVSVKSNRQDVKNWYGIGLAIYPYNKKFENNVEDFILFNLNYITAHLPIPLDDDFMSDFRCAYYLVCRLVKNRFALPNHRDYYDITQRWIAQFLANHRACRISDVEKLIENEIGEINKNHVYLPKNSVLIIDIELIKNLLPNDLKSKLMFSTLPLYGESKALNKILNIELTSA